MNWLVNALGFAVVSLILFSSNDGEYGFACLVVSLGCAAVHQILEALRK